MTPQQCHKPTLALNKPEPCPAISVGILPLSNTNRAALTSVGWCGIVWVLSDDRAREGEFFD